MFVSGDVFLADHAGKQEEVSTHNRYSITYNDNIFVVTVVAKQAAGSHDS
jgi:thiamine transporter ThiT